MKTLKTFFIGFLSLLLFLSAYNSVFAVVTECDEACQLVLGRNTTTTTTPNPNACTGNIGTVLADAQACANRAQAQGQALGYNISCSVNVNRLPDVNPATGLSFYFDPQCSISSGGNTLRQGAMFLSGYEPTAGSIVLGGHTNSGWSLLPSTFSSEFGTSINSTNTGGGSNTGSNTTTLRNPTITGIQGFNPATNVYTNYIAVPGQYLVLYGAFSLTDNTVTVGTQSLTPSYQSLGQLNIPLPTAFPTGQFGVKVQNSSGQSNTMNVTISSGTGTGSGTSGQGGTSNPSTGFTIPQNASEAQAQILGNANTLINTFRNQLNQAISAPSLITTSLPSTGGGTGGTGGTQNRCQLSSDLRIGDRGASVTVLTQVLVAERLLEGTQSIFDSEVQQAVIAYQERYASSILTPNGLTRGTGFVGPSTRAYINSHATCTVSGTGTGTGTGAGGTGGSTVSTPTGTPSQSPTISTPVSPSAPATCTIVANPSVAGIDCPSVDYAISMIKVLPGMIYSFGDGSGNALSVANISAYVNAYRPAEVAFPGGMASYPAVQAEIQFASQKASWFKQVYGNASVLLIDGATPPEGSGARLPIALYNQNTRSYTWMTGFGPAELEARGALSSQWTLTSLFRQMKANPPSTINPSSQASVASGLGTDTPMPNSSRVSGIGATYRFNGTVWVKQ